MTTGQLEEMYLYLQMFEKGIVSVETILEKLGIDVDEEVKRKEKENKTNPETTTGDL